MSTLPCCYTYRIGPVSIDWYMPMWRWVPHIHMGRCCWFYLHWLALEIMWSRHE